MPSGIILKSASEGATQEAVENVLKAHGHEIEETETAAAEEKENAEPLRDSFDSEEEFEAAHVEWQDKTEARKTSKSDEEEEEEDDEEEAEKKPVLVPRRKGKFAQRLDKMVSPLRRENAELKARLEKLEKGEKTEPEKKTEPNPRPKRDKFATDEEYEDALLAWGVEKKQKEDAAAAAKNAEKETFEQNLTNYRTQVEEAKDKYEDWDEVVGQPLPIHQSVQLAIMEQENGAEVVYYLGRHPLYTKQLAEKSPLAAVMEIGRLSDKLLKGSGSASRDTDRSKTNEKTKTKVPPPVRPVSTAATSSTLTSRDAAKNRDYKAFKVAQRAGR